MTSGADQIELRAVPDGVELAVKVVPGSSRDRIVGPWNHALRLAVAAPPDAGQANRAVVRLLAGTLSIRRHQIRLVRGQQHALKHVHIAGLSPAELRQRLARVLGNAK